MYIRSRVEAIAIDQKDKEIDEGGQGKYMEAKQKRHAKW